MARCIKAIPNEVKNEFLIGLNNQKSSFLTIAEYDELNNKIKIVDLIDFEEEAINKEQEDYNYSISNVIDIYPIKNDLFLTQLHDTHSKKNVISSVNLERLEDQSVNLSRETTKNFYLNYSNTNIFE